MKKAFKNYTVFLSAFTLLAAFYPVMADEGNVNPAEPNKVSSVQELVDAVNAGQEQINVNDSMRVEAASNITNLGTFQIPNSTQTINGMGYELMVESDYTSRGFTVDTLSTLNLENFGIPEVGSSVGFANFTSDLTGGAVVHNNGILNINNSVFSYNKTAPGGDVYDEITGIDGGAIFNAGDATITNSVFKNNTSSRYGAAIHSASYSNLIVKDSEFINNSAHSGGAIYNDNRNTVSPGSKPTGKIHILNSNFEGNKANQNGGGFGGAIVTVNNIGAINISNSTFKDNYADLWGGAIDNLSGGKLTVLDSTFVRNKAGQVSADNRKGGAIHNHKDATLNIIADKKDTYFAGNLAGGNTSLNAIHNEGVMNLNAGDGSVIIRDGITGRTDSATKKPLGTININSNSVDLSSMLPEAYDSSSSSYAPHTGIVELSGKVGDNIVNLNGGILKLSKYKYASEEFQMDLGGGIHYSPATYPGFLDTVTFNVNGGILDTSSDDNSESVKLGNVVLNRNVDYKFDVSSINKTNTSDKLAATSLTNKNNNKILLKDILINTDHKSDTIEVTVADDVLKSAVAISPVPLLTFTDGNKGNFETALLTYNNQNGLLTIGASKSITDAVKNESSSKVYTTNKDTSVSESLGSIGTSEGTVLNIDTEGHNITAQGNNIKGFNVQEGQTLTLHGAGDVTNDSSKGLSGFSEAIKNEGGAVTVHKSVITENKAENGGAINNVKGDIVVVDAKIVNNTAEGQGGAIYNAGNLTVIADKNDTKISGNTNQEGSSGIHNTKDGSINLNASYENKVVINDSITGEGGTITVNKGNLKTSLDDLGSVGVPSSGTVEINNTVKNNNITVNGGTLKLGSHTYGAEAPDSLKGQTVRGNFDETVNLTVAGSNYAGPGVKLDLLDNDARELKLGKLTLKSNLNFSVDADLGANDPKVDKVTASSVENADGHSLILNEVNILSDAKTNTTKVLLADDNLREYVKLSPTLKLSKVDDSIAAYLLNYDNKNGLLTFEGDVEPKLPEIIQNAQSQGNYILAGDNSVTQSLGKLAGTSGAADVNFTIYGDKNNLTAEGDNIAGVQVTNGQTLNLVDIGDSSNKDSKGVSGFTGTRGGFIENEGGEVNIANTVIKNNKANEAQGGAIYNDAGTVNISADQRKTVISGNLAKDRATAIYNANKGVINLNAGENNLVINDGITGPGAAGSAGGGLPAQKGEININKDGIAAVQIARAAYAPINGTVEINAPVQNNTVNLYNGSLKLGTHTYTAAENPALAGTSTRGNFSDTVDFNVYGGLLSLQDGTVDNTNLGNVTLYDNLKLALDTNFQAKKLDTITANSFASNGNNIKISDIKILKPTTETKFSLTPLGEGMDPSVKQDLAKAIIYEGEELIDSPIYLYSAEYDPENAVINFTRSGSDTVNGSISYNDFNKSVFAGEVAAKVGGYLNQLNSYNQAFDNMDTFMLMTSKEREALKMQNQYAITEGPMSYAYEASLVENGQMWFKPYATYEKVSLKHGPKVENTSYGSFFGGDSKLYRMKHGFDGMWGLYAGYNGSHQNYDGISMYQNGGLLGLTGTLYKGNFFTGLTANVGGNGVHASTAQGGDDFGMFTTGVAGKMGYNIEFNGGKAILQPSYQMSYSLVNTFDYTNSSGVRVSSDPLNALHIEPGLKLIGNTSDGWQPYLGASMVWNIVNDSEFFANDVSLPELSIKPYVRYGVGLRKARGKYFTGFLQAYFTNGGRNGMGLQSGFNWFVGRDKQAL